MRKLKSFWALMCLFLLSSTLAFGQQDGGTVGSVEWAYYSANGKLVIKGSGSMGSSSPSYLSSYKTSIKMVEIGGSVTDICPGAFKGCTALTSVTVGSAVTKIGNEAFANCSKLATVTFSGTKVASIGDQAFDYCESLSTFSLAAQTSLTSIGQWAFRKYPKTSIALPSSVKTFGAWCFTDAKLTSFTVPASATTFGGAILCRCPIETLTSNSSKFTVSGDLLIYNGTTIVATKKNIERLDIPYNVTTIQGYVFDGCTDLKNIIHGWNLTSVGDYAFANCTSLVGMFLTKSTLTLTKKVFDGVDMTKIYATSDESAVRSNLKSIGFTKVYDASYGSDCIWYLRDGNTLCVEVKQGRDGNKTMADMADGASKNWDAIKSVITKISFPKVVRQGGSSYNYITKIGNYAFQGLTKVTELYSSYFDYVTSIGNYAFDGCTSLSSVNWTDDFDNLTSIGNYAFRNCAFTSLSIPTVTTIGEYAFRNNKISSITLPKVTSIGANAFRENSLTTLSLPTTLKTIGNGAFAVNTTLGSVTIPSSVTSIGTNPFWRCPNVSFTSSSTSYVVYNKCLYNSAKTQLISGVKNGSIASTVTTIGADAFYGLGSTTLTIPASVTTFGGDCFGSNTYTSIIDERSAATAVASSFNDATKSGCKVQVKTAAIKTLYTNAGFTAANVMVTSCGDKANWSFDPSTGTLTITGSDAIKAYGNGNFPWNSIMTQIKSLSLSSSITSIPSYAFNGATNMTSTTVSSYHKLTSIGASAFYNTALTEFAFPSTLTTINANAFYGTKLTSVSIPAKVSNIDDGAFANVKTLATISVVSGNGYYRAVDNVLMTNTGKSLLALGKNVTVIPSTIENLYNYSLSNGATEITIPSSVKTFYSNWAAAANQVTKLTVLTSTKPSGIGNLNKTSCEIHVGSPVQSTAKTIYSNWKTSLGFSKVVYDYCGRNLKWAVSSNKLTITNTNEEGSTGAMWDFAATTDQPWVSSKTSITSVAFSGNVTSIGSNAFSGMTALTSVSLPNTVTSIGNYAFQSTSKLTSVTLPAGLKTIKTNAFASSGITSITIPASVTSIDSWGANSLKTVKVDAANATYTSQDKSGNELNMLMTKAATKLILCPSTTENVTLPSTMSTVDNGAFNGTVGKLTIPASVITMNSWPTVAASIHAANVPTTYNAVPTLLKYTKVYASTAAVQTKYKALGFTDVVVGTSCGTNASYFLENGILTIVGAGDVTSHPWTDAATASKIKKVIIESGITTTPDNAFEGCSNLTSIKMAEGFQDLGDESLKGCTSLKSLEFPSSMEDVINTFVGSSIEKVSILDGGKYTSKDANGNELNALIYKGHSLEFGVNAAFPENVDKIAESAFNGSSFKEVSVPSNVTSVDENAFANNQNITAIYWSTTLDPVDAGFEAQVKSKAKVYVVDAATKQLFVNAGFAAKNIYVAESKLGTNVWYAINGTKLIVFGSGAMNNYVAAAKFYSTSTGESVEKTAALKSVTIASGITSIGHYVFAGCTAITGTIEIPTTVASIGQYAFGTVKVSKVVSNNVKPAAMLESAFTDDVYGSASLVVPDNARNAYNDATGWEKFAGVQTESEVANPYDLNKDGVVDGNDSKLVKANW